MEPNKEQDVYRDWYDRWAHSISENIMYPLLDGAYELLWKSRRGKLNYDGRHRACYAETAVLASQVLGEEAGE